MELVDALNLADELMAEHGLLPEWTFKFDRAKQRFGQCVHRYKTISLSAHLVELNPESEVRQTLLHEIAHALCLPSDGHNRTWQLTALRIGADGRRCYGNHVVSPNEKWIVSCQCGSTCVKRHRRPPKTAYIRCAACGTEKGYSPIVIRPNEGV